MADTSAYEVYHNIQGCPQRFHMGTGKLQPDTVIFGETLYNETNAVYIDDIRFNPWSSDDILRLEFNGVTG